MLKEKNLQKLIEELETLTPEKLTPRERDILRLHLGLDDGIKRGFEEIGQLFEITRTETEEILNSAIQKTDGIYTNIMQILGYKQLINNIFSKYIEIPNDQTEELIDKLEECLSLIDEDKREIFKYYFGIITGENEDFTSTAKGMGIEEDEVERAVASAFRKLRHPKMTVHLKKFETESEKILEEKRAKFNNDLINLNFPDNVQN